MEDSEVRPRKIMLAGSLIRMGNMTKLEREKWRGMTALEREKWRGMTALEREKWASQAKA